MSLHGSWWPSQVVHLATGAVIALATALAVMYHLHLELDPALQVGAWTTVVAATLAEGKAIHTRTRSTGRGLLAESNLGDALDWLVYVTGAGLLVIVSELVTLIVPRIVGA